MEKLTEPTWPAMPVYDFPPLYGLIIENDWQPPGSIRGFVKDNIALFKQVDTVLYAKNRMAEIGESIQNGANAIIVSSTFMYKDQLEEAVTSFAKTGKPLYFFCDMASQMLNRFIASRDGKPEDSWFFQDYDSFIEKIHAWVKSGLVYEIHRDDHSPITIHDDCHNMYGEAGERDRKPWTLEKILYSEKHKMFHRETDDDDFVADQVRWTHRWGMIL